MSSAESNKASFLSYASQDAEAARRIGEALRSGGVEVWFDADGGLEHGDEWDAKIRRQIKECVLSRSVSFPLWSSKNNNHQKTSKPPELGSTFSRQAHNSTAIGGPGNCSEPPSP